MHRKLKALSLRQPWTKTIFRDDKPEGYRSNPTKIRGSIYTYAAKGRLDATDAEIEKLIGKPWSELDKGLAIGTVEIVDCTASDDLFKWHLSKAICRRITEAVQPFVARLVSLILQPFILQPLTLKSFA
ncbi:hypothetical protein Poly24_18220 [Rosistilla carotiformis]|uniref:ASCH domain protein n=2 Tax=Rosistilla carotiformis TaxID=2528017 RepID=A0A518JRE2_9BACT|nr:hypothetical protein Poly24_18220 [Rosistilla carotiformis]